MKKLNLILFLLFCMSTTGLLIAGEPETENPVPDRSIAQEKVKHNYEREAENASIKKMPEGIEYRIQHAVPVREVRQSEFKQELSKQEVLLKIEEIEGAISKNKNNPDFNVEAYEQRLLYLNSLITAEEVK